MVMKYDNEFETKENKNQTKDKIESQQLHRRIQHLLPLLQSVRVDEGEAVSCYAKYFKLKTRRRNRLLLF